MRRVEILRWVEQLEAVFGSARPPIDTTELYERYQAQDYGGMLAIVAKSMRLDMKLRIGYVKSGGPKKAPAWVNMPAVMPPYGTHAFKETLVTVYVRKEFLNMYSFPTVIAMMAHELSHVLLNSIGHVARGQEEAVDLTAILFGYGEHFVVKGDGFTDRTGYLSIEEVKFARAIMG